MRRILIVLFVSISLTGLSQKPSLIGFSGNIVDFSASLPKIGKVDPGLSLMYWKGITKKIDFSARYNGVFSDYKHNSGKNPGYINEFEGALHARPINDDHAVAPFITAGVGIGNYGPSWVPYAPLGIGVQFNMLNEDYIFLQANYRVSFNSSKLDNNMFYSIGFTQSIRPPRVKEVPKPLVQIPAIEPKIEVKDEDKDGVVDSVDACPDVAGLAQFNGCPDTDGDGIIDKEDKCPTVAGLARYNGCPIPDTDNDGINDEEDKCPNIPGIAANNGCPEIKEETKKKAEYAAQRLYFATGSYKLLEKSFKGLDDVASLLESDPALKLNINGYTDNTGNAAKNQVLSENRAASVKKYLVGKGIDESRIKSTGYGILDPVADNKTATGRAKNRRVEFKLEY